MWQPLGVVLIPATNVSWLCRWPWNPAEKCWIYYESITSTKYITIINTDFFFWGGPMAFLKYMIKKGKKGMVYSLLLLPNMAWPFLFTSIHSLPIPATPLYKWDFFLDSQFMLGSMMVRICIYIHMIYVSCGICIYQKAAGSSCFILAVSGFSVSPPRFHDLITKERREIDFNAATRVDCLRTREHLCHHTRNMSWSF